MILNMNALNDRCDTRNTSGSARRRRATAHRMLPLLGVACVAFVLSIAGNALAIEPEGPDQVEDTAEVEYEYDYAADTEAGTVDEFKDELDPHGTWVEDPTYGTVWVPDSVVVGKDFQPYRTNGRWAVSDEGDWVWLSDYDWGYIPFHYGRWVWSSPRGWVWIPGRVYAPAWVVWRTGSPGYDYIGWAPAPPSYVWVNGFAVGYYATVTVPWWYCRSAYFFHPHWHNHWVTNHAHIRRIHSHTHVHHRYHGRRTGHGVGHRKAKGTASGKPSHKKATAKGGTAPRKATGKSAKGSKKTAKAIDGKKTKSDGARSYAKHGIPKSPTFKEARIPDKAVPKTRVKPDQKALKLRKPFPKKAKTGPKRAKMVGKKRGTKSSGYKGYGSKKRYGTKRGYSSNKGYTSGKRSRSTVFPRKKRTSRYGKSSSKYNSYPSKGYSSKARTKRSTTKRSYKSSPKGKSRSVTRTRTRTSSKSRPSSSRSRTRTTTKRSRPRSSSKSTRSRSKSRSSSKSRSRSSSKSRSRSSSKSRSRRR